MGFFANVVAKSAIDNYWYNPIGTVANSGVAVTAEASMKISAVWASVRLIAESISTIPLPIYRNLADGDREKATDYYLYKVIHDQPNRWQTSQEFREMLTGHAILRGNGYARIVPGRRGFADQLVPLHPDRMQKVEQLTDYSLKYTYLQPDGRTKEYGDEEIFHLRGLSNNGITGMSVVDYARESFGLALATESYGARFFSQNARPGGVVKYPKVLGDKAKAAIKEAMQDLYGGLGNAHKVAVFDDGMEWQQIGLSNEDSQFLETRSFQIADIARWFRVPLHMIQEVTGSTSWGSGLESLSLAFVIYTLLPWATRWESAIKRDLITSTDQYYAEHVFEGLLRGDMKARYEAYQIAAGGNAPWMVRNEIRRRENMNRLPGLDEPLKPLNMGRLDEQPKQLRSAGQEAHYDLLLHEAAARVVRKEITVLSKAAKRCASDTEAWRQAIEEFYADHAGFVVQALRVERAIADWYVIEQKTMLLDFGMAAMETWEQQRTMDLVQMIKGERVAA